MQFFFMKYSFYKYIIIFSIIIQLISFVACNKIESRSKFKKKNQNVKKCSKKDKYCNHQNGKMRNVIGKYHF